MAPLMIVVLFAALSAAVVEAMFKPVRDYFANRSPGIGDILDLLTPWISWGLAAAAVWFARVNAFSSLIELFLVGRIATAMIAGVSSKQLNKLFDFQQFALDAKMVDSIHAIQELAVEDPPARRPDEW